VKSRHGDRSHPASQGMSINMLMSMDMIETCPKCGGTATFLKMRDDFEEIPDLSRPTEKVRFPL
jgi:hypothetical protein